MDVEGRRDFWTTMRAFAARGKTIVFATHYLEEADAYADRAVLMARGRIVADGPTKEIKAMVGTRTIRATLGEVDERTLVGLPGVSSAERRGEAVVLVCSDSDAAIRALLDSHPQARDIEIAAAGLEEAFMSYRDGARAALSHAALTFTPASSCCARCATGASLCFRWAFRWCCTSCSRGRSATFTA